MRRSLNNRPLRSVLANRKMFQGGGIVANGGGARPMANMQPNGILASSPNLINSVVGDAVNPQGGNTLSMADGGIARFDKGGSVHSHPHAMGTGQTLWRETSSPREVGSDQVPSLTFGGYEQVPYARPVRSDFADSSIGILEAESPSGRVERMFPDAAGPGGRAHKDTRPHSNTEGQLVRWASEFASGAESIVGGVAGDLLINAKSLIDAGFSAEMDPESESYIENFGIGERTTLAHLVARAPEGLQEEIMAIGKSLISQKDYDLPDFGSKNMRDTEGADGWVYTKDGSPVVDAAGRGGLAFNPLAQDIAQALHDKYEKPKIDETYQAVRDQERMQEGQVATVSEEILASTRPQDLPTNLLPVQEWGFSDLATMKQAHLEKLRDASDDPTRTPGGGYPGYTKAVDRVVEIIQNLQGSGLPSSYTDELLRDFQAEDDEQAAASVMDAEEQAGAVDAKMRAQLQTHQNIEAATTEGHKAAAKIAEAGDAGDSAVADEILRPDPAKPSIAVELADAATATTTEAPAETTDEGVADAANQARVAYGEADTEKKQKEAQTSLEAYIEKFKSTMPDYEGKTESEKGMDIVKMGMAIAAGESPNAITNISKGVMATIDNFTSDDKERRAYKRQVELSAAKYALDGVARDTAQENADERQLFFFYDQSTKDKDNPYGKMVTLSMADIISNGGEIPPNLLGKDLVSSSIVATRDATALLTKNLTDNYAEYKIGRVEAKEYVDQLDEARDALIRSESGINLLAMTKQRIIGANLGSFGTGFKELLRKGATIANIKLDKSYNTVPELRADVQIALQELIKASLGTTQAANSISNKDVELLANAYVDTAFTADGSFSFLGIDEEALGRKLDQAIDTFRNRQKGALSTYDRVLSRLDQSEAALKQAQALGLTVLPGPFTRDHFKSLDEIKPYSDRIQSGDPDSVSPQLGESVISTDSGDFNLIDGKYVYTPRAN